MDSKSQLDSTAVKAETSQLSVVAVVVVVVVLLVHLNLEVCSHPLSGAECGSKTVCALCSKSTQKQAKYRGIHLG